MPHDKNVIFFPRDACGTGQRYVLEKTSAIRQGVIHRACPFDIAPTFHDRSPLVMNPMCCLCFCSLAANG